MEQENLCEHKGHIPDTLQFEDKQKGKTLAFIYIFIDRIKTYLP